MATPFRVDPRVRAYGKARIDITRRAQNEMEWQSLWREPRYSFPFTWGGGWKQCIQYTVDDFAAEIGFFIDVLGFPVSAFSPNYAQFTSPDQVFYFGVVAASEGALSTPPDSLRIQFMVKDLPDTIQELEQRGVTFERKPDAKDAPPSIALLRSPHGVLIELWGTPESRPAAQPQASEPEPAADFWTEDLNDEESSESEPDEEEAIEKEPTQAEFEEIEEDEVASDEPVYVDDEETLQKEPVSSEPTPSKEILPRPRPSFPTAVIRRTEDLLKGGIQIPSRKGKGNGKRGFPTQEDSDSS